MKIGINLFLGLLISIQGLSQKTNFADATLSGAKYQATLSLSYVHLWTLGAKQKFSIGLGGRFTSYFGANQYYITAPAQLTSESSSPLILFKDNITANIDTFLVKSPQVNSINASINIHYQFNQQWSVGFNIDAIGFSFGGMRTGNYINGFSGKMITASPTPFNVLLISDNDHGSLNSEFFVKYFLNEKYALKLGAQFLFTEYTTTAKVQQFPELNDRFRNKSLLLCVGISYRLKNKNK